VCMTYTLLRGFGVFGEFVCSLCEVDLSIFACLLSGAMPVWRPGFREISPVCDLATNLLKGRGLASTRTDTFALRFPQ